MSCERTINLYAEPLSNDPKQLILYSFPGLQPVATLPSGPVRGLYEATNGTVWAATSTQLFQIFSGWTATARGSLPIGTTPVSMVDNGAQLLISANGQGFIYDFTAETLTTIVPGEPSLVFGRVAYISGYFVTHGVDTRLFWYSNLLDGLTWDALSYYAAEARADNLETLYVDHNEMWLFGSQTIEIWIVTGDSLSPFARSSAIFVEQGIAAPWSVVALDSTLYFLGGTPRGEGPAYKMQGYQPQRISNHAFESALSPLPSVKDGIGFSARHGGHAWYGLWFADLETTWLYDNLIGGWTEVAALAEDGSLAPWPVNTHCMAHGLHCWGSYTDGALYTWNPAYHFYGDRPRYCERTGPFLRDDEGGSRITFSSFQLQCLTGQGLDGIPPVGDDPAYRLSWTTNGESWSYEHIRRAGVIGRRERRVTWRQLGSDYERAFRVTTTDPVFHAWRGVSING